MKDYVNYGFKILSVCQGVWVLTLMGFLMYHYVNKSMKNRILEKNAISMGLSYSFLTLATMISSINNLYQWDSIWQIVVLVGYALGDYAIVMMVFHVQKNQQSLRRMEKYIKEHQAEIDKTEL